MSQGQAKPEKTRLASVDEARAAMLAGQAVLEAETISLSEGLGRVLAAPILASRDQPPFSASMMDGYALRAMDTAGRLTLGGEAAAGRAFTGQCVAGMAIRISTGAALPEGADAVVMQEDVKRSGDIIEVSKISAGENVRPRGMDFREGTPLLQKARRLDGVALALAAAAGAASLHVVRKPRLAILTGGDELAEPGSTPGPYQIFDSATHGIAALASGWGASPFRLKIEKDDEAAIARAAENGFQHSDLLVMVGGASVGDHDHARPALMRLGLEMMVDKVNLRPGKPCWFGRTKLGPVLGLPGNPASALVCAHLFLKALLEAMMGRAAAPNFQRARLTESLPANASREHYLRARLESDSAGGLQVRAFEQQDSSLLSIFASANALIRLVPNSAALAAGDLVDVLPLDSSC